MKKRHIVGKRHKYIKTTLKLKNDKLLKSTTYGEINDKNYKRRHIMTLENDIKINDDIVCHKSRKRQKNINHDFKKLHQK